MVQLSIDTLPLFMVSYLSYILCSLLRVWPGYSSASDEWMSRCRQRAGLMGEIGLGVGGDQVYLANVSERTRAGRTPR